jgi:hypothetical protein
MTSYEPSELSIAEQASKPALSPKELQQIHANWSHCTPEMPGSIHEGGES